MHKFRRSDRIECALLAGTVCGVLTGAGVLPWWMTAVFAVIMAGFFRKYALISAVVVLAGAVLQIMDVWDKALNVSIPLLSVLILIQSIQEHKEQKKASAIVGYVCFVAMVAMIIGTML